MFKRNIVRIFEIPAFITNATPVTIPHLFRVFYAWEGEKHVFQIGGSYAVRLISTLNTPYMTGIKATRRRSKGVIRPYWGFWSMKRRNA
jgi:hypothetical protein